MDKARGEVRVAKAQFFCGSGPFPSALTSGVGSHEALEQSAFGGGTAGEVQIEYWHQPQRFRRAIKFSGGCVLAALVCILIPILHFVLVPGFLIAAPFLGRKIYLQKSRVVGGGALCPSCGKDFKVAKGTAKFPLNDLCSSCQNSVKVVLASPADDPHQFA